MAIAVATEAMDTALTAAIHATTSTRRDLLPMAPVMSGDGSRTRDSTIGSLDLGFIWASNVKSEPLQSPSLKSAADLFPAALQILTSDGHSGQGCQEMRKSGRAYWLARTIVPPGNLPPCCFAVFLARGDKNNIGPSWQPTLAIFADCSAPGITTVPLAPAARILPAEADEYGVCSWAAALCAVMERISKARTLAMLARPDGF